MLEQGEMALAFDQMPEHDETVRWLNGECAVMAYALHKRFDVEIHAFLFRETIGPGETYLAHAMVLCPNGKLADVRGQRDAEKVLKYYASLERQDFDIEIIDDASDIEVFLREVTIDELRSMTETFKAFDDTTEADAFIDKYPEFFNQIFAPPKRMPRP
jgi:hypothetical protein